MARPGREQRPRIGDDGLQELVEGVGTCDRLRELRELLELRHA